MKEIPAKEANIGKILCTQMVELDHLGALCFPMADACFLVAKQIAHDSWITKPFYTDAPLPQIAGEISFEKLARHIISAQRGLEIRGLNESAGSGPGAGHLFEYSKKYLDNIDKMSMEGCILNYKSQAERQLHSEGFDKNGLSDIAGISIPDGDAKTKICTFLQAAGNPYLFRVGDIGVHVVFSGGSGDTLQKRICHLLSESI